jgi:adenosine deaminase CECR1
MTAADSPKKRKRIVSPFTRQRIPIQHTEPKHIDIMDDPEAMRAIFDKVLVDHTEVNKYIAKHDELLRVEEENAWDRDAKAKADELEQKAAFIIREIREHERNIVFGNQASEAIPGPDTRDMGGQFLTNKDRIDHKSLLFEIAVEVPKGGLLHLHFNAELHPEKLLVQARGIKNMYIRSIRPLLTKKDLDETEMVFNVLPRDKVEEGVDIFSETYPGNATNWRDDKLKWKIFMPWEQFQKDFEKHFPDMVAQTPETAIPDGSTCCTGPAEPGAEVDLSPAERWLKSKMVLSEEEAYGFTQTVNG